MNRYTFASQSGKAYYCNSIEEFINDNPHYIIGQLVNHSFEISKDQVTAWENQINVLQIRLKEHGITGDIIFEYNIVRLGKRIDVVLLIRHMVFSIEFKNGKGCFTAQDAQQAEDYALDIKNFHKESEDLYVCPILVATEAHKTPTQSYGCYPDKQVHLQQENIETLLPKISMISNMYGDDQQINFDTWFNSPYHPTPTIIAAAVEAYNSHNVGEIAHSEAGQENVNNCESNISKIINYAKTFNKKCICFVTGVPGAGKTLVGIDTVAKNIDQGAVYISGNGPLVEVLREAIKKSILAKNKERKALWKQFKQCQDGEQADSCSVKTCNQQTSAAINAIIQSSYAFKEANASSNLPTHENILIFDEAQRVWSQEKMSAKHDDKALAVSEPHLLLSIMNRHHNWAVVVCLVGLGQDIYDGEVGINEWFRCGIEDFQEWEMFYSPAIFHQIADKTVDEQAIRDCQRCHEAEQLHLQTSIRSFRADRLCKFVEYLLANESAEAKNILECIEQKYPVRITRNYKDAKQWIRRQVRGSQRCGVLACSSAQRLKPEGIYLPKSTKDIDIPNWFLAPSDDLRSSNKMEIVAREFDIQGLEVDWALVCWDADFRRNATTNTWDHYTFRGTKWVKRKNLEQQRYLANSYRVLLTRARQGMVIFVPEGVSPEEDSTRNAEFYDGIYNYLRSCGIKPLNAIQG